MKKKLIEVPANEYFSFDERSLKDIKDTVQALIDKYGEGEVRIESDYEDRWGPRLYIKRLETDRELASRIRNEERYEKLVIERDKKEFKRLKKQFGEQ